MTVSSTTSRWEYTGDGSVRAFTVNNKFFSDSDLDVYVDGALQTLGTDYTVTGAGDEDGGTVTFVTAPANSTAVLIIRDVPDTQTLDLPPAGAFPAESVEDALDRRTIVNQQAQEELDRAFKFKATDSNLPSAEVPALADIKGKLLGFNSSTGAPQAVTPDEDNTVTVTSTGSTTSRTLADRFAETVNVLDFGAVGDGATDDTAAFNACTLYAKTNGLKVRVPAPASSYLITSPINIYDGTVIEGDGKGITTVTCQRCNAIDMADSEDSESGHTTDWTIRGLLFLSDDDTSTDGVDHIGANLRRVIRVWLDDCEFRGFTDDLVIDGRRNTAMDTWGCGDLRFTNCTFQTDNAVQQTNSTNNYPRYTVRVRAEADGTGGPDGVAFYNCRIYGEILSEAKLFAGDGATAAWGSGDFDYGTIKSSKLLTESGHFIVDYVASLGGARTQLTPGTEYSVSGVGTNTPDVDFSGGSSPLGAPPQLTALSTTGDGTTKNFRLDGRISFGSSLAGRSAKVSVNSVEQAETAYNIADANNKAFTFTADAGTDKLTVDTDVLDEFIVGRIVRVSSTGTLPAGLSSGTDYYATAIDDAGTIKLAASYANAVAGTPTVVDITDAGTGTHTVTVQNAIEFDSAPGNTLSITVYDKNVRIRWIDPNVEANVLLCRGAQRIGFFSCAFGGGKIGIDFDHARRCTVVDAYFQIHESAVRFGADAQQNRIVGFSARTDATIINDFAIDESTSEDNQFEEFIAKNSVIRDTLYFASSFTEADGDRPFIWWDGSTWRFRAQKAGSGVQFEIGTQVVFGYNQANDEWRFFNEAGDFLGAVDENGIQAGGSVGSPNSNSLQRVATRTLLKTLTGAAYPWVYLAEGDRAGPFEWDSSDLSTEVTADPQEGWYVPPDSDSTGASGAWVRVDRVKANALHFGAVRDGATSDRTAIQAAVDVLANIGGEVLLPPGTYALDGPIYVNHNAITLRGVGGRNATFFTSSDPLPSTKLLYTGGGYEPVVVIGSGAEQTHTFTADSGTNVFTISGGGSINDFANARIVRLTTTGTLPSGLSTNTDYYITNINTGAGTFQLAANYADADAGTPVVSISDNGTGTHTMTSREEQLRTGIEVSDIQIYGDAQNIDNVVGLRFERGAINCTLTRAVVQRCKTAVHLRGYDSYQSFNNKITAVHVEHFAEYGVDIEGDGNGTVIERCKFANSPALTPALADPTASIRLGVTTKANGVVIDACSFGSADILHHIIAYQADGVFIVNNEIESSGTSEDLNRALALVKLGNNATSQSVTGFYIAGNRFIGNSASDRPISVLDATGGSIVGNSFFTSAYTQTEMIETPTGTADKQIFIAGNYHAAGTTLATNGDSLSLYNDESGHTHAVREFYAHDKISIGTQTPATQLHIEGSTSQVIRINATNASADSLIQFYTESTPRFALGVDGDDADSLVLATGSGVGSGNIFRAQANGNFRVYGASANLEWNNSADSLTIPNAYITGYAALGAPGTATISSGVATLGASVRLTLTPQGGAVDDLDTLNGAAQDGQIAVLSGDGTFAVTAKDGTGNLALEGDFVMDAVGDRLTLMWDATATTWFELARANVA